MSRAGNTLDDEDVAQILAQSRANNLQLGLTGALLYQPGKFIQIIEGPEDEVLRLFRRISTDPRHRSVHLCSNEPIEKRQFAEWSMGFRALSGEAVKQLAGFEDLFGRTGKIGKKTDPSAQLFLDWLSDYWFSAS